VFEWLFDPYSYPFWIFIFTIIAVVIGFVTWAFSTHIKFTYPTAKFEAIGNPFITEKELTPLLDSKTLTGFTDELNTKKDYNITGNTTGELQQSLDTHLIETTQMMRKDSAKELAAFYDVHMEKHDIILIKNTIKQLLTGRQLDPTIKDQALREQTRELLEKLPETSKEDLPALLTEYGFERELIDMLREKPDSQTIDLIFDKYLINKLQTIKLPHKCDPAHQRYVKSMIDIRNIKNLLRAKHLEYTTDDITKLFLGEGQEIAPWKYTELTDVDSVSQVISGLEGTSYFPVLKDAIEQYEREGTVQVLETALDSYFLKQLQDISLLYYTNIGPTLRFLVSKEYEIANLKMIVKGLGEQLSPETMKRFLVMEAT
jgi:V/A-type H+-transporting ATPase subunit C